MAKLSTIAFFKSVSEIKETFHTTLPQPYDWRLCDPITGCINGLPTMQGVAVATNGIIVAILQADKLLFGHLDFFVADESPKTERNKTLNAPSTKSRTRSHVLVDVSEFI